MRLSASNIDCDHVGRNYFESCLRRYIFGEFKQARRRRDTCINPVIMQFKLVFLSQRASSLGSIQAFGRRKASIRVRKCRKPSGAKQRSGLNFGLEVYCIANFVITVSDLCRRTGQNRDWKVDSRAASVYGALSYGKVFINGKQHVSRHHLH